MTRFETPRVAVVGAGEIGRGWAALAVGAGWPVTIYDADATVLNPATEAIGDRVVTLIRLKRAEPAVAEDALSEMRVGRSLLQTVAEADWIIEAVPDDLSNKQKTLQQCEQVSRLASILTSSASSLGPSALASRLERPERFLVTHPLNPVELIPLVEVVPGPRTDPECVEDVRFWLSMLGRAPIVLKKEVDGNIASRLNAALWRECIQLVLDGVLDVEDVDRAVSVGPALVWAAAGPHLAQHLSAGEWDVEVFLSQQLGTYESIWKSLAEWKSLPPEEQKKLSRAMDKAYSRHLGHLKEARDQRLVRLLEAMRE
jgi:3-hydroxyacyl-CoA dehydrogenase